jgi:type 1 glutamine amidotransferase
MLIPRIGLKTLAAAAALCCCASARALEEIPKHQAKQIEDAAPAKAQVAPKRARRVLIWVTPEHLMGKDPHKGYNIPYAACAMKTLGTKTGAFEPVVSQDLASFLPGNLKQFDAIVLCNASGPWITPSDEAMGRLKSLGTDKAPVEQALRRGFVNWLRGGRGLVAFHYAIGGNPQWPQFKEIIGAGFSGHPWNEEVGVKVEEPGHPVLAAFGSRKSFRVADEIFQFTKPYSRDKLRVLLSLDTAKTNMKVKWIDRTDNDFALAWVKSFGQGRVFYTALGHRTELFWNPVILAFYLDGIQFATGDLDAPTAPRPDRKK